MLKRKKQSNRLQLRVKDYKERWKRDDSRRQLKSRDSRFSSKVSLITITRTLAVASHLHRMNRHLPFKRTPRTTKVARMYSHSPH